MKILSYLSLVAAIAVFTVAMVSKYVMRVAGAQPASYLLMVQILILLSINLILFEVLKQKK